MLTKSFQRTVSMLLLPLFSFFLLFSSTASLQAEEVSEQTIEEAILHIKKGIALYQESDFNQAISELNRGLEILEKSINQIKATKELTNAHLHLGLAYIGTANTAEAKAQFKQIVQLEPDYALDTGAYSPKVVSLFNEAKAEYLSQMVSESQAEQAEMTASTEASEEPSDAKKPIYKKWWFWTLIGAAAIGIAVAAGKSEEEDDEALLEDNFDDDDYDGWLPMGNSAPFWTVENKKLTHIDNYDGWSYDVIRNGSQDWNIESFDVTLSNFSGDPGNYEIFIIWGMKDEGTWFFVNFNYGSLCLHQQHDWDDIWVENTDYPLAPGKKYRVSIEMTGSEIEVYVNDHRELSHPFSGDTVGFVGLGASSPTPIQFDDVEIWPVSERSAHRAFKDLGKKQQKQTLSNKIGTISPRSTLRK